MLAVAGAAMIALAACDGGGLTGTGTGSGGGAQPSASPSSSGSASNLAAWLEVAKCVRAHGHPDFPDPVEDGVGGWKIPDSVGNIKVPACDDLVRKAKQQTRALEAPSAADLAKLRQYAKCVREHGIANFPDPDSDGSFNVSEGQRNSSAMRTAARACKQYLPPQPPKGTR
jgi:hypothetical protein